IEQGPYEICRVQSKYLDKIEGVSVVKQAEEANFQIGTVAVDVNGNKFDSSDVHTWKDETGKERYYVLLDNDANGNQVRSEVTFKDGKPLETKAAEIQTVKTEVYSEKRTDKVTMGAEVAYQTNEKETWDEKTTSKDGATVYAADKRSDETNVKVFSVGKNALHRESVTTESSESVETEFDRLNGDVLFVDGKPVVLSVDSNKSASSVTDRLFQDGQDKANEQIKTSSYEGNRKNAAGVVQGTWAGHDNSTTVDYAAGQALANTFVQDQADEVTAKAVTTNVGFNYDGTAKANIGSNTLRDNGTVDAGLAVKDAQAGDIVVDTKLDTSNKEDTKTYQDGGVKALESTTVATNVQTVTYADGTTGTIKSAANNQESTVTLFNKGKADKYREAVNTTQAETTGKTYKTDADGDIILANGKPVEQGTSSDKQTVKTTENLYQIGQERKTDTVVVTDTSEKTANVDGSGRDLTAKATDERIEYRAGQKDGKESEVNGTTSSELKVTNTDKTGYTYKVNGKTSNVTNATEMHLLATRDVKSVQKSEWTESLAASGKNAVSITRGNEVVNRTDESRTGTVYGSETVTAATGTTTVAKKEVDVTDKFGTFESSTLSRTETKVAADKSSTVNTKTRAESVDGVVLTSTQTNTDAAGKAVTSTRTTSLNSTTGLTTDQITLNGKDLQTELNRMGNNIDDVQRTAYRGIAIALAAQQAVPNIAPGQVAVFGGVGHYEGETAGSIGVVTSFTDRISASGAFGFAGGSEFGGRVGVAYVFGGK
ncbi:YadA C-terminal domain-containing protein, partial [Acinetobacter junii]|uniref:YadA C-terminal domain-containing protein n=1 Tax=Acinetobacter junii TaxID=40215 RepID=UPI001486B09D